MFGNFESVNEVVLFEFTADKLVMVAYDPDVSVFENRALAQLIKAEGVRRIKLGHSNIGRVYCSPKENSARQCA